METGARDIEPVDCLRCGAPIEAKVYESGSMDVLHGSVGAGYHAEELDIIGEGDRAMGIAKVVQLTREVCMNPGYPKVYAGVTK
jgi:hypothetical protein